MKSTTLKILGLAATIVAIGANLLNHYVGERTLDAKIEENVSKALAKKEK